MDKIDRTIRLNALKTSQIRQDRTQLTGMRPITADFYCNHTQGTRISVVQISPDGEIRTTNVIKKSIKM